MIFSDFNEKVAYFVSPFKLYFFILSILLFSPFIIIAQVTWLDTAKGNIKPDKSNLWNKMLNGSYATLIGAEGSGGILGNYASLDPFNASLAFKGTVSFGKAKKNNMSFLGIEAQGELVDGSFATIFKNSALNTSAGIKFEYNFKLSSGRFANMGSSEGRYLTDDALISYTEIYADYAYRVEINKIKNKIKALTDQNVRYASQISLMETEAKSQEKKFQNNSLPYKDRDLALTDLQKLLIEIPKIRKNILKVDFQIDSMNLVMLKAGNLVDYNDQQQRAIAENKRTQVQKDYAFGELSFLWLTLIGGAGKKDYYTFDPGVKFSLQLKNPNLTTHKIGFALNYYFQNFVTKKAWLLNIGLLHSKDNNISQLSTQEIVQESVFKNSIADTTRKATKKYNAYTEIDKIVDYQQWNVYSNVYFVFNEGNIALHLFPSFYKPNGLTGYLDTGIGLMFSFKDQKKEKSILNLETYASAMDVFNSLDSESRIWDRNEFGVRVTLPFNKLFK